MNLIDSYPFPPGVCACCGGIGTPVIDTLAEDVLGNRVYVCAGEGGCLDQMARLAGWASPDERRALGEEYVAACERAAALEADRENAKFDLEQFADEVASRVAAAIGDRDTAVIV